MSSTNKNESQGSPKTWQGHGADVVNAELHATLVAHAEQTLLEFKENLAVLQDLQDRVQFIKREVDYLLKSRVGL